MSPLRTALADDEPLARERLRRYLREAGCEVVAEIADGLELLHWLQSRAPADVLFLDIQMPGLNALEVLAEIEEPPPVVFVTAHPEFAIQSYDVQALDFLLKPVYPERLARALDRVRNHQVPRLNASALKDRLAPLPRVAIKAGDGTVYMDLKLFTHFQVIGGAVLAFRGRASHPTHWTRLKDVEKTFPAAGLMRIHRDLLLRPEAVVGSRPALGGRLKVRVADGVELTTSHAMAAQLKARLGKP